MKPRAITVAGLVAALAISAVPAALASSGDRDSDRMPDRWERSHGLSTRYDDSRRDPDRDHLSNYREYRSGTHPHKRDSDRDGVRDAREDSDHDGVRNKDERHGSDRGEHDDHNGRHESPYDDNDN